MSTEQERRRQEIAGQLSQALDAAAELMTQRILAPSTRPARGRRHRGPGGRLRGWLHGWLMPLTAAAAVAAIVAGSLVVTRTHVGASRPSSTNRGASPVVYVAGTSSNGLVTLIPVFAATGKAGRPIEVAHELGGAAGLVLAPDGKTIYLLTSASQVIPVSTVTGRSGRAIQVRGHSPAAIAITPDGKTVYVVDGAGGGDPGTVTAISTAEGRAGPAITIASDPSAIAVTPDGETAYVLSADEVTPISTARNSPGTPIRCDGPGEDGGCLAMAITPDSRTLYVTTFGGPVIPVATGTGQAGPPIRAGVRTEGIAITPNGRTAYVSSTQSDTVTPISTATGTAGQPIPVGEGPLTVAVTPDGRMVYVLNYGSDTVTPIATATGRAGKPVVIGQQPVGIVFTPDGKTAYVLGVPLAGSGSGPGTLIPIGTATNTAGRPVEVPASPVGLLVITP